MAKKIVVANWKMNPKSLGAAKKIFQAARKKSSTLKSTLVVVCPPAIYLNSLLSVKSSRFSIGAQDVSAEKNGPYTGEISAVMLEDTAVKYCIVGHSERRAAGDTDEIVSKKMQAIIAAKINAVFCIGESARDDEAQFLSFLRNQIHSGLINIKKSDARKIIVAYEPIWAIGKNFDQAITPRDLYEMSLYIKKILAEVFGKDAALEIPILYGGSVSPANCYEIVRGGEVDGLLIGRESLDIKDFGDILTLVDKI